MSKISSLNELERAHIIGIGGSGMSGLAVLMHESGCTVTGSDLKRSRYVRELEDYGIDVRIGHDAAVIDELELDEDDGLLLYEGEVYIGSSEYEFELSAKTGRLLEWEAN